MDFICVLIIFIISLVSIKSKCKEFVLQNSQKIQKVKPGFLSAAMRIRTPPPMAPNAMFRQSGT